MKPGCLCLMALMMSQAAHSQAVPEGIHRDRAGPPELCGLAGASLSEIERTVLNDQDFVEENSTDQYRIFNRERDFLQMVFPRPSLHPFAMATCRKIESAGGGSTIRRELECEGTRAQCDAVFLEFKALDDRVMNTLGR